jgi:hypothetical protein
MSVIVEVTAECVLWRRNALLVAAAPLAIVGLVCIVLLEVGTTLPRHVIKLSMSIVTKFLPERTLSSEVLISGLEPCATIGSDVISGIGPAVATLVSTVFDRIVLSLLLKLQ